MGVHRDHGPLRLRPGAGGVLAWDTRHLAARVGLRAEAAGRRSDLRRGGAEGESAITAGEMWAGAAPLRCAVVCRGPLVLHAPQS